MSELDRPYFEKKLQLVLRDIAQYTSQELALELYRLSATANPTIQSARINELEKQLADEREERKKAEERASELFVSSQDKSRIIMEWKQRAESAEQRNRAAMEQEPMTHVIVDGQDGKDLIVKLRTPLYAAPILPADVAELQREVERLRHENHNLNWALGAEGYPNMYTESEQAEADEAHNTSLQFIGKMKERKNEFDRLQRENAELRKDLNDARSGWESATEELNDSETVRNMMQKILDDTAITLKGPNAELSLHSWHDLAEVAARNAFDAGKKIYELTKLLEEAKRRSVPEGIVSIDADFISNGGLASATPTLILRFAGDDWKSRDAAKAMLSAAPQPNGVKK